MALSPKSPGDQLEATVYNIVQALAEGAMRGTNNLSEITDPALARAALGLGNVATRDVGTTADTVATGAAAAAALAAAGVAQATADGALTKASNLSDLSSASAARSSLGLGNTAVRNVGTTTGTVAAGDDARLAGALQASNNLADLTNIPAARAALAIDGPPTAWPVGTSAGTVAAGDDRRFAGVLAFGAVGDGVVDDTAALQDALDAVPAGGGEVILPGGRIFLFSAPLFAKSGTTICGDGTLKAAPIGDWAGSPYYGISNVNYAGSEIVDSDITVSGITIDYTDLPSADGTRHCIYFRKAKRIRIEGVTVLGGSSAIALRGCDDTQEIGNRLIGFSNCGSDHWDGPGATRVIGCHIETDDAAQMVNYNPDPTNPPSTGYAAAGFVMMGNTLISHEANATPVQIEPLRSGATVRDVAVIGNRLVNVWLVLRGDTAGAVVADNIMSGFQGAAEAITGYTRNGGTPAAIVIAKNIIRDPLTSSGNAGVIRMESGTASMFANVVMGSGYLAAPFYRGTALAQMFGNYADTVTSAGFLGNGFYVAGGSANPIGWTDSAGTHPRMYQQITDDNWIFQGTDASGAPRTALSMFMRSSTSDLIASVPMLFSSPFRTAVTIVAAAGTAISTATALTGNLNNVTSCTAGVADGVRLAATTGRPQKVINSTAATLKVYPNNSGSAQIDAGGASAPVTIAPGKSKTFELVGTDDFRTTAAT